jgi:RNA polymerase sigma-32 factor
LSLALSLQSRSGVKPSSPSPARSQANPLFVEYAATGDPGLARRLAEANIGLTVAIARALDRSGGRYLADLIQEGHVGLLEAIRRFDPHRGVGFSTYAGFWIRAMIMKYIRDNCRLVRVGRSRADRAAYSRGELPPAELSLDAARDPGQPRESLADRVSDGRPSPEALLEVAEVVGRTRALARQFDRRELAIMEQRLLSDHPRPLRRVARQFSISGERVRQIESNLLVKLRQGLQAGEAEKLAA